MTRENSKLGAIEPENLAKTIAPKPKSSRPKAEDFKLKSTNLLSEEEAAVRAVIAQAAEELTATASDLPGAKQSDWVLSQTPLRSDWSAAKRKRWQNWN